MNDLDDIDERERQEAEALARALDGEAAQAVPEDAIAVAAFLRAARGAHEAETRVAELGPGILATQVVSRERPRRARRALILVPSMLAVAAGAFFGLRIPETEIVDRSSGFPSWDETAEREPPRETAAAPTPSASSFAPAPGEDVANLPGDTSSARRRAPGFMSPEPDSLSECEQARDAAVQALMSEGAVTRDATSSVRAVIVRARMQDYAAALDSLARMETALSRAPIPRVHADLLRHALVHERGRLMLAHAEPDATRYLAQAARTFEGSLRSCTERFAEEAQRRSLGAPSGRATDY